MWKDAQLNYQLENAILNHNKTYFNICHSRPMKESENTNFWWRLEQPEYLYTDDGSMNWYNPFENNLASYDKYLYGIWHPTP